jgi:hypothetical protein
MLWLDPGIARHERFLKLRLRILCYEITGLNPVMTVRRPPCQVNRYGGW